MSDILTTMGESWYTPSKLSALLRQPPSTTRAAPKRLQERGEVRYRPDTDEFQVYPVRETLREYLAARPDLEHNAAAVAEALPELGLTWRQTHVLLADLAANGDIECWFGKVSP